MPNPIIRPLTRQEMTLPLEWAAAEGWNPGLADGDCFHAADPQGFLVAMVEEQPVAVISAVTYQQAFAFLGFYIVKPEWRGQGYGIALWNAALQRLSSCTIGLDGVVAQQENYRRSGFVLAHGNQRFQGMGGGELPVGVVEVGEIPLDQLVEYDARHFTRKRTAFLQGWRNFPGKAVIRDGRLAGYGIIRPCRVGHKIGPLFADTPQVADTLFQALASTVPQATLFLDLPLPNPQAVALAHRHKMTPVFETARMYRGTPPDLPLANIYGITSFELG
ncbi:MAG: GNAT family N-acetyltransferase [Magnetococcales bacterium]|nr:GNAT family N-acetyltransferase [Magnetococcales bacterium]NGZ29043.1 GNAT family N-acetyltransferase [Magnetococcales bacterium]